MSILANNFSIKLCIVFVVFLMTLMNVAGTEPINDEDYSLDNDYYDQSYNFKMTNLCIHVFICAIKFQIK